MNNKIKTGLKRAIWFGTDGHVPGMSNAVDDPDISVKEFIDRFAPGMNDVLFNMPEAPSKRPDEDAASYERRLIMWQAACDSRRAEAKADKRALLRWTIICIVMAIIMAWVTVFICLSSRGEMAFIGAGIFTVLVLVICAIVLFNKFNDFKIQE